MERALAAKYQVMIDKREIKAFEIGVRELIFQTGADFTIRSQSKYDVGDWVELRAASASLHYDRVESVNVTVDEVDVALNGIPFATGTKQFSHQNYYDVIVNWGPSGKPE